MSSPIWFITGASRGLGLEIARAALQRGDSVVAAARDPKIVEQALGTHEQLLSVELDVTSQKQIDESVALALSRFGQIDILVNNAGRGLVGAVEEASAEEVRSAFAVNVEGLLAVSRAVLPSMRKRRSGRVLNLSSVGGFSAWSGWGVYSATKFAVEGLSEAMHAELLPLGIHVTVIEPGPFRTDFLSESSLGRSQQVIEDYSATGGAARRWAEDSHLSQPGDPVKGAAAILEIATTPAPPLRLQLGVECVQQVQDKLKLVAIELEKWKGLAESTEYDN
ncbi:oxidoreductase [Granulicella sp. dw_53]|uniref:oxidoreductase n=1 Tax=Granulicella sp. dw_53 TaxID=2719792 RepID=UPI001BD50B7C|nr:oxidoreductase [Granulicella sp. dw_53]